MSTGLVRREFLKRTGQVAALTVAGASGGLAQEQGTGPTVTIPQRVLGRTGLKLPILGFGGAALPKMWGNSLSHDARVKLVRYAYDRGIRYFDTAGNYMESQPILGEALQGIRDQVTLVSKVEATDPDQVRGAMEKSLGELKTDHLDVIHIHGTPGLEQMTVKQAMKIHQVLLKLKEEGVVKFIGFSAHAYFDKALALIDTDGFDLCMLSYGYISRGYDQIHSARMMALRDACLAAAHTRKMGIVAMKVVGAGLLGAWSGYIVPGYDPAALGKLPGAAIRYVLQDDRIHCLCIGMRLQAEIDTNLKILQGNTCYTHNDRALLAQYCASAYNSDAIKAMKID